MAKPWCYKYFFILHTRRNTLKTSLQTEAEIRQRIWTELQRATQDRHHEWRTPVLATVSPDGLPQARSVVLRQADAKLGSLQIYTDGRSPKVAEISAQPALMLVFWSKRLNWQLRVQAKALVEHTGSAVDAVWARVSQSPAVGDYLSASAPGDSLPASDAATAGKLEGQQSHHLSIVTAQVQAIDWLELSRDGHRRAVFQADAWEWRVP